MNHARLRPAAAGALSGRANLNSKSYATRQRAHSQAAARIHELEPAAIFARVAVQKQQNKCMRENQRMHELGLYTKRKKRPMPMCPPWCLAHQQRSTNFELEASLTRTTSTRKASCNKRQFPSLPHNLDKHLWRTFVDVSRLRPSPRNQSQHSASLAVIRSCSLGSNKARISSSA